MPDPLRLTAVVPANGRYRTVCIDGRGGSGKTALADHLAALMPDYPVLHGDDYFEPHADEVTWGEFNEDRFDAEVLTPLRTGDPEFTIRPYDFPHDQLGPERVVAVRAGLILERWLSFALPVQWDLRIWVETPAEVCLARGLARDGGQALGERARLAWETVWQPREEEYIRDFRPMEQADLVLDGARPFADQLDCRRRPDRELPAVLGSQTSAEVC